MMMRIPILRRKLQRTASGLFLPMLDRAWLRKVLMHQAGGSTRVLRKSKMHALWDFEQVNAQGKVLWAAHGLHNLMPDVGEEFVLKVVFSEEDTIPVDYHIGLTTENASNIDENTTLALITDATDGTEPSGNGYARQPVPSSSGGFTVADDGGDFKATTTTETFTASGGPIPASGNVDWAFLTEPLAGTSGVLVSMVALGTARSLADGDSLNVSMGIKLSE